MYIEENSLNLATSGLFPRKTLGLNGLVNTEVHYAVGHGGFAY